jgi:hypothetical protein
MKSVRLVSAVLFLVARLVAWIFLLAFAYAVMIILLSKNTTLDLPISVSGDRFTIFFPFTRTPFLLGEYGSNYLFFYFFMIAFYSAFLWLLSDVFAAFKQTRLFTKKGVLKLSRFYIINLSVPLLFALVFVFAKQDLPDLIRITGLHLVIGVFAFFMASIFRQGLILQEEQDLIF